MFLSQIKLVEKNHPRPPNDGVRSKQPQRRMRLKLSKEDHSHLGPRTINTIMEDNNQNNQMTAEQQPPLDAKERLQRFDLVIQHLHRLRATLALDPSVRDSFQKFQTLTLLGQSLLAPQHHAANGFGPNFMNFRPPSSAMGMPVGPPPFLGQRLPLPPGMPVKPPEEWLSRVQPEVPTSNPG